MLRHKSYSQGRYLIADLSQESKKHKLAHISRRKILQQIAGERKTLREKTSIIHTHAEIWSTLHHYNALPNVSK